MKHVVFVLAFIAWYGDGSVAAERKSEVMQKMNELYCGPRCVQYVLRHYGSDECLAGLISELQPEFECGTSLARMRKALEERGVYTSAEEISSFAEIRSSNPAIVHLNAANSSDMGHYVVWLPESTRGSTLLWDGLFGCRRVSRKEFRARCSGRVLFTSPTAMADSANVTTRLGLDLVCAGLVVVVGLLVWRNVLVRFVGSGEFLSQDCTKG